MHGLPRRISTRADIDNLWSFVGTPFDTPAMRAAVIAKLRALLTTDTHYVFSRVLTDEADRAGPEPECRVLHGQGDDSDEIHEFVLTDNPGSLVKRIGMTAAEINALIQEIN